MEGLEIENVSISILINSDKKGERYFTTIELYDEDACIQFLEIKLTNDQFMSALSRLVHVPVKKCTVNGLNLVGKKRLQKELVFEVKQKLPYGRKERNAILFKLAKEAADPGWEVRDYFNSQSSVTRHNDIVMGRTIQFKYIDKEETIDTENIK